MAKPMEGVPGSLGTWVNETKAELKKVVWPTRSKVQRDTIVVLTYVFVVGVFIWSMDAVYLCVISWLVR